MIGNVIFLVMEPLVVQELSLIFQRMVTMLSIIAMDLEELLYLLHQPDRMNSVGQVETGFPSLAIMAQHKVAATG